MALTHVCVALHDVRSCCSAWAPPSSTSSTTSTTSTCTWCVLHVHAHACACSAPRSADNCTLYLLWGTGALMRAVRTVEFLSKSNSTTAPLHVTKRCITATACACHFCHVSDGLQMPCVFGMPHGACSPWASQASWRQSFAPRRSPYFRQRTTSP